MYRTFKAEKDAYITDRVIKGVRSHSSNVGKAGSIDIYKLYGATKTGTSSNNELTRGLIKFDITKLKDDFALNLFDINSSNFRCLLKLSDVYGGQTTPSNFTLAVHPLSMSFDEGVGKDIVFYQDSDACNFLTASSANVWFTSGANAKGTLGANNIDVISSGNLGAGTVALWVTQSFVSGDEDMSLDVTRLISGTLAELIPDYGFRISFVEEQETDLKTRFVKRFSSRHASDITKQPKLTVTYDDSVRSDFNNFIFDYQGTIFFYNKVRGNLRNIISGSTELTGTNCLKLKIITEISGGTYTLEYSGSQHLNSGVAVTGVYSASFAVSSSNTVIASKIAQSSSVIFDLVWGSNDGTVGFYTSSAGFTVSPPSRNGESPQPTSYIVTTTNVQSEYKITDSARIRVHVEDNDKPLITLVKQPYITPSVIVDSIYYSIRDAVSDDVVVDFDFTYNATKMSSDSKSLWFDFEMSNLYPGHLYEIDAAIVENGLKRYYRGISPAFKVESTV